MNLFNSKSKVLFIAAGIFLPALNLLAEKAEGGEIASILQVQQYDRAIHIMAMLLIGFGFLMVFVRKYGRSALTATFLLVSIALPIYMAIKSLGMFETRDEIQQLILAEFAAASLLIAAGAILGRIKMYQYMILGMIFVPLYIFNEWVVVEDAFHIIGKVADTGGSIVIHAFGALFGIAAAISLTSESDRSVPIESDATTDKYSVLGSMVLWVFWPSFCAALVPVADIPHTVVNVFLALCGSTIATYLASVLLRGKVSIADIANAALAGGVAIGATCDFASHPQAMVIGLIAGAISTIGFAVLQNKQQAFHKIIDTCGVSNLHGIPGIFGGLAAIIVIKDLSAASQLKGIVATVVIAVIGGLITGKIVSLFGHVKEIYNDGVEFKDAEL
jgi:ammonium transporter Rh